MGSLLKLIWGFPVCRSVQLYEEEQPVRVCLCSRDMRLKVREQAPHWYFFTSEWVCRWARRLERSAKARLQWGQENGRSPEEREGGEQWSINQAIKSHHNQQHC